MNKWLLLLIVASFSSNNAHACLKKCFGRAEKDDKSTDNAPRVITHPPHTLIIQRTIQDWQSLSKSISPENSRVGRHGKAPEWTYKIIENDDNCIEVEDRDVSGVPVNLLKDKIQWHHNWHIKSTQSGVARLRLECIKDGELVEEQLVNITVID